MTQPTRIGRGRGVARAAAGLLCLLLLASVATACAGGSADDEVGVALIIKTQTNPYFVSMRQAARKAAAADGAELSVAAGTADGDTQTQINAIYTAIARQDQGILITSNGDAVNAALRKAKDYGLFVIALDTPLDPASTADSTYATNNEQAGKLVGQYAAARLGGKHAVIAMLDLYDDQIVSVDVDRDHGFLEGMGIDPGSTTRNAQEAEKGHYSGGQGGSYEIACHQATQGAVNGGRTAMEQCLSRRPDINMVYSINEPAGRGAYAALKVAGKTSKVVLVSIDGSCQGIGNVREGMFAADATQYPTKMASKGVATIVQLGRRGTLPASTKDKRFVDTGTNLVTANPVKGLSSQSPKQASTSCWGSPTG